MTFSNLVSPVKSCYNNHRNLPKGRIKMKIIDQGIVYSGANTPKYTSCAFPGICQLHNGTLIASFKGAARKIPDNATDCAVTVFSYDNEIGRAHV